MGAGARRERPGRGPGGGAGAAAVTAPRVAALLCALLALPLLGVVGAWLTPAAHSLELLRHQATTVLPG